MNTDHLLFQAFVYLCAAVISVPIAKRLGMGSVLGYLLAGVIVGPYVLDLVGRDQEGVMHFSEFGVVMMLFLIGLELKPQLLWRLRNSILGMGGTQVVLTTAVIMAICMAFNMPWQYGLTIGMTLALSSTAIVLQTLNEKGWMKTAGGKSSFAVLLFQDVAVIPMLAVLPILAIGLQKPIEAEGALAQLSGWAYTSVVVLIIAAIIIGGHYIIKPAFRVIAETKMREIFTAAALLLVIATALAMQAVGLSPALGAFIAGVVLAESEYRHELETNIEPFKGLLLGLFFITVGASINFPLLLEQPLLIMAVVLSLIVVKFIILFIIATFAKLPSMDKWMFSVALAQAGEFAFVLLSFSRQNNVLPEFYIAILLLSVALSMLVTPVMIICFEKYIMPRSRLNSSVEDDQEADEIEHDSENEVIVVGFGRFGTTVGRLLIAQGYKVTVLDYDTRQIDMIKKFGLKVFYGDATRPELLESAGAGHAKLLVVALSSVDKTDQIVDVARKHFPQTRLLIRVRDRNHAYALMRKGVPISDIFRDCFGSSINMCEEALKVMGQGAHQAYRTSQLFASYDKQHLAELYEVSDDEENYLSEARKRIVKVSDVLQSDKQDYADYVDHAWEDR